MPSKDTSRQIWNFLLRAGTKLLLATCLLLQFLTATQPVHGVSEYCKSELVCINQNVYFLDKPQCTTSGTSTTSVSSGDQAHNEQVVFTYLTGKGLSGFQAAGVIGNMIAESRVNPLLYEGDEQEHAEPPDVNSRGWGIVQWTPASKIVNYARSVNKPPGDLGVQLDFLWSELSPGGSEAGAGDELRRSTTVEEATVVFETKYERHAGGVQPARVTNAKRVLAQYGGTASGAGTAATPPSGSTGTSSTSTGQQPTIVLDPGHGDGGGSSSSFDPVTGVTDGDYFNVPEGDEAWNVSQIVKAKLETDGYKVVMTKNSAHEGKTGGQRAQIANASNAALAVSIHDDHGQSWDTFAQLYYQKMGLSRTATVNGTGKVTTFNNQPLADKAKQYADIFVQERSAAEGRPVDGNTNVDFNNRDGLDPGNIPLVNLLATMPWMYNEVGAGPSATPLGQDKLDKYAQGLINSIEKAVPSTGATGSSTSCSGGSNSGGNGVVAGNIVQTALNLAWDTPGHSESKPTYIEARKKYNPGSDDTDCGRFVATVMIASGVDPDYTKVLTTDQKAYVKSKPDKYITIEHPTAGQLKPGDILVWGDGVNGHTMIYVGPQPGGFVAVDASLGTHVPQASASVDWMLGEPDVIIARVK